MTIAHENPCYMTLGIRQLFGLNTTKHDHVRLALFDRLSDISGG